MKLVRGFCLFAFVWFGFQSLILAQTPISFSSKDQAKFWAQNIAVAVQNLEGNLSLRKQDVYREGGFTDILNEFETETYKVSIHLTFLPQDRDPSQQFRSQAQSFTPDVGESVSHLGDEAEAWFHGYTMVRKNNLIMTIKVKDLKPVTPSQPPPSNQQGNNQEKLEIKQEIKMLPPVFISRPEHVELKPEESPKRDLALKLAGCVLKTLEPLFLSFLFVKQCT